MSKRKHETDYAVALENEYARWDEMFTKGGSDPSWADGVNLNLVRNHILYDKEQLEKQESSLFGLPDVYYRETPPEVDSDYMARPDEIRENARKAMEIIDADENLKFVREQSASLSEQQRKQYCLPAIINYAENLRRAIAADDLIIMRRYEHLDSYLESFESAAIKIRDPESTRRINDNLTVCDPGDDEDIEDDFNEECSETEQAEDESEEDFQLRLF
ncbi:MAG: hypothetical protein OSJ43_17200 [Oscillospiraceae bacterium]|nr:hypothetical protein [Oscillospiraceae bacterium]